MEDSAHNLGVELKELGSEEVVRCVATNLFSCFFNFWPSCFTLWCIDYDDVRSRNMGHTSLSVVKNIARVWSALQVVAACPMFFVDILPTGGV